MWDHKKYWRERRVFYVCYSSISLSPFPSIVYQIYWILSCNMSQQNCNLPRKCLFDIFPIRFPFSNFMSYMQTYTWVLYVMKVHYLQASQLSTPIHLITGRNISMCPPGSTRHFQQSSHGFHARILENKIKEKRTLFRGGHAQGTRGNQPKPDQQDPLGTAYHLSSEGLEDWVVSPDPTSLAFNWQSICSSPPLNAVGEDWSLFHSIWKPCDLPQTPPSPTQHNK